MIDLTQLLFIVAGTAALALAIGLALEARSRTPRVPATQDPPTTEIQRITGDPDDLEALLRAVREDTPSQHPVFRVEDWTTGVFTHPAPSRSIPSLPRPRATPRTMAHPPATSRYAHPIDDVTTAINIGMTDGDQ